MVSVLLPEFLVEGLDLVATAEYSDRSAIIKSAVKSYLQDYVEDELTQSDMDELRARASQRSNYIPYDAARKRLGLVDSPKSRTRVGRTRR